MDEDAEICRVCRCDGTTEQPLFHPCKCSGSIRHVHQECLTEWLSHSRKKYCELCEHPFSFTPVYRTDMPETLPITLFIKQLYKKAVFLSCTVIRAFVVSSVWLILVPYLTVWTWRFYLWSGENLAHRLSRFQNSNVTSSSSSLSSSATSSLITSRAASSSSSSVSTTASSLLLSTTRTSTALSVLAPAPLLSDNSDDESFYLTSVFPHSFNIEKLLESFNTKTFLADCFEGQIITCIVVIAFVTIFLLREWIIQNIPAELEEDEEEVEDEDDQIVIDEDELMDETVHSDETEDHNQYHHQQQQQQFNDHDMPNNYGSVGDGLDRRREAIYELQQDDTYQTDHNNDGNNSHNNHNNNNEPQTMDMDDSYPKPVSSIASASSTEHDYSHSSEGENTSDTEDASIPMATRGEPPNAPIMRHIDHHFDVRGQRRAILFEEQVNDDEMMLPPAAADILDAGEEHHLQQQNNNNNNVENDDNEMEDENFGDDIDGILEAIGMRGNYWMLAQNSALMSLLISLCLGAAVWVPYVTGIMFIMESPFQAVGTVLWIVRKATDPLLDTVFLLCTTYISPFIPSIPRMTCSQDLYQKLMHFEAIHWLQDRTIHFTNRLHHLVDQIYLVSPSYSTTISTSTTSSSLTLTDTTAISNIGNMFSNIAIPSWSDTQITFNNIIEQIRPILNISLERYHNIAVSQLAFDRFICISIGYSVIIAVSYWYLSRTHVVYATFGRSARQVIRQQGIILKVAMFIAIELLLFPIVCGILLDLSSLSLFKEATMESRVEYLQSHPLASVFLHWFLGTAFMFLFAILVTICREIVRPGVLWFIRDPNDPQFHPIREIVERPVLTQLQKIGASGVTYACVIVAGVGGIVWCLGIAGKNILPLHWNMSQPLSTLPVDFLVVHIAIPAVVKYFEPKQVLKTLAIQWMRFLCEQLRLTSFMFGERRSSEEGVWHYKSLSTWIRPPRDLNPLVGEYQNASFVRDGQLVLAPKHDAVPFDPARRMLVPVHPETLEILDSNEQRLGHPAAPSNDLLMTNTCIVYIPPYFKQRVMLFLLTMWTSSSMFICTLTVLPIALGRIVYQKWLEAPGEVHDLYAYFVGSALMLFGIVLLYKSVDAVLDITRQATVAAFINRLYFYVSDTLYLVGKTIYLIASIGVVFPLIVGLMVELYVIMPFHEYGLKAPTIEIMAMWTRGIACMSTLHGIIHLGPDNPWRDYVNMLFQHNIRAINLREITYKFILPFIASSITMIICPFLMALANIRFFGEKDQTKQVKLIQVMYPAVLVGVGVYYLCRTGAKFGRSWIQIVREDNYLVGRTLHNFDNNNNE